MRAHLKGEFIAVIEIDDFPFDDFPDDEPAQKRFLRKWQRRAIEEMDAVAREIMEKHGITIAIFPECVDGAFIE
jgi:hypothetical protein